MDILHTFLIAHDRKSSFLLAMTVYYYGRVHPLLNHIVSVPKISIKNRLTDLPCFSHTPPWDCQDKSSRLRAVHRCFPAVLRKTYQVGNRCILVR